MLLCYIVACKQSHVEHHHCQVSTSRVNGESEAMFHCRDGRLVVPIQSKCCSKILYNSAQILASVTPYCDENHHLFLLVVRQGGTLWIGNHMFFRHVFGGSIHLMFVKEIVITNCMSKGFTKNGRHFHVMLLDNCPPRRVLVSNLRKKTFDRFTTKRIWIPLPL